MPVLKVEILGSEIEINYEANEKAKLIKLIDKFKQRLNEFPNNGKINDKVIIFLSALKAEDELQENITSLSKIIDNKSKIDQQSNTITKLNNQIIILNSKIEDLKSNNLILSDNNSLVIKKIIELEKLIESIKEKIKNELT